MTPPFPLPPQEGEDPDPVEALLQLAANGRQCSLSSTNVTATEQESDEGIVSDQSNEFEENKKVSPNQEAFQAELSIEHEASAGPGWAWQGLIGRPVF